MAVERIAGIAALRQRVGLARRTGLRVGCVPTMGALHAGHTALFGCARDRCDLVVATLFVNPLQFDRRDDLARYPRDLESDLRICERHGVDILFAPDASEMYPSRPVVSFELGGLDSGLCGASRPGHFRGVATVVAKLLNIVQPDIAWFGEKDFQQLVIIRRLVEDLNLPVEVASVETVREPDGLAVSSRNVLLTKVQRAAATVLIRTLRAACDAIEGGDRDASRLRRRAMAALRGEPLASQDYFEIVDPASLESLQAIDRPVRVAAAAYFGTTRLIDNLPAFPPKAR